MKYHRRESCRLRDDNSLEWQYGQKKEMRCYVKKQGFRKLTVWKHWPWKKYENDPLETLEKKIMQTRDVFVKRVALMMRKQRRRRKRKFLLKRCLKIVVIQMLGKNWQRLWTVIDNIMQMVATIIIWSLFKALKAVCYAKMRKKSLLQCKVGAVIKEWGPYLLKSEGNYTASPHSIFHGKTCKSIVERKTDK